MPITIKGIKITQLTVNIKGDEGDEGITSQYALMSSEDKVLAKQDIGGYNGMKLSPSADTIGALNEFLKLYKRDINTVLGLETE